LDRTYSRQPGQSCRASALTIPANRSSGLGHVLPHYFANAPPCDLADLNTLGIYDAVKKNLRTGARVVICGRIALAGQFGKPDIGERFMGHLIVTRASIHGFLAFDWWHRRDEALQRLSNWQHAGQIKFKEDVLDGIERMPEGFLRLLSGKNFGKQIIKII
jgi:NADPH-dependent curcumin reductase CurA